MESEFSCFIFDRTFSHKLMAPRTESQLHEIRENKRAHIVETALELFAYDGYSGTSISRIAHKAGIAKGLIYSYFSGKEELLRAVVLYGVDRMLKVYGSMTGNINTDDDLKKVIDITFEFAIQNKKFWLLYYSLLGQPAVYEKYVNELAKIGIHALGPLSEFFRKKGSPHPDAEALLFHSTMDGTLMHYLSYFEDYPVDEIKKLICKKFGLT